jgi:hypothetical protein
MVAVFRTNVACDSQAHWLSAQLRQIPNLHRITFDLDDCDKILRIEGNPIPADGIIALLSGAGFLCTPLQD